MAKERDINNLMGKPRMDETEEGGQARSQYRDVLKELRDKEVEAATGKARKNRGIEDFKSPQKEAVGIPKGKNDLPSEASAEEKGAEEEDVIPQKQLSLLKAKKKPQEAKTPRQDIQPLLKKEASKEERKEEDIAASKGINREDLVRAKQDMQAKHDLSKGGKMKQEGGKRRRQKTAQSNQVQQQEEAVGGTGESIERKLIKKGAEATGLNPTGIVLKALLGPQHPVVFLQFLNDIRKNIFKRGGK